MTQILSMTMWMKRKNPLLFVRLISKLISLANKRSLQELVHEDTRLRKKADVCVDVCDHDYNPTQQTCNKVHNRRHPNKSERKIVLEMTNGQCFYQHDSTNCHVKLRLESGFKNTMEVDHRWPFASGGYDGLKNWVPVCSNCNRGRGGKFQKDETQFCIDEDGENHCRGLSDAHFKQLDAGVPEIQSLSEFKKVVKRFVNNRLEH